MDPFHFCSGTPGHFNQTPKTGTGTDPKIQIKVQIQTKIPIGYNYFEAVDLEIRSNIRNTQTFLVYVGYTWVFGYFFGITNILFQVWVRVFGYNLVFRIKFYIFINIIWIFLDLRIRL